MLFDKLLFKNLMLINLNLKTKNVINIKLFKIYKKNVFPKKEINKNTT